MLSLLRCEKCQYYNCNMHPPTKHNFIQHLNSRDILDILLSHLHTFMDSTLSLQSGKNVGVHFIHVQGLERRKRTFESEQFDDGLVDAGNAHHKISPTWLFGVDLNLSLGPDGFLNFASSRLERASLLAGLDRHNLATCSGGLLLGGRLLGRGLLGLGGRCLLRRRSASLLASGRRTCGLRHGYRYEYASLPRAGGCD